VAGGAGAVVIRGLRLARRFRPALLAGLWLVLGTSALVSCSGLEDQARAFHQAQFNLARRVERDPAGEAAFLRSFANGLERDSAGFYGRAQAAGVALDDVTRARPAAVVAEWRARAAAIEANPRLYAQTQRCAADIVGERFRLRARARSGPQPECGHCVGTPTCESRRP